jgi:hypothetical protein
MMVSTGCLIMELSTKIYKSYGDRLYGDPNGLEI